MSKKIKIGILFGGRSGEHDVSLMSAQSVMGALDAEKYQIVPIGITREGQWMASDPSALLASAAGEGLPSPDNDADGLTLLAGSSASTLMKIDAQSNLSAVAELDVIFPVLHGTFGEDGTVQGLLELANVPYIGAGVVGSATGMDKAIFKHVMESTGLPVLPWKLVLRSAFADDPEQVVDMLEGALDYPMFTKPANLGSSVGICKCNNRTELMDGLKEATAYDRRVVVEQGVNVRELEVAVLGNDAPMASVVGEVAPKRDFYDYVAKYISDDSDLYIPAAISAETSDKIRALAIKAFKAIDCAGLGRVDFLLDTDTNDIYINEINTIPGFTRISMYPKLWEATGLSYPDLLDRLVGLAIERYEEKSSSKTTFESSNFKGES